MTNSILISAEEAGLTPWKEYTSVIGVRGGELPSGRGVSKLLFVGVTQGPSTNYIHIMIYQLQLPDVLRKKKQKTY